MCVFQVTWDFVLSWRPNPYLQLWCSEENNVLSSKYSVNNRKFQNIIIYKLEINAVLFHTYSVT